jgi:hypothetical protein
VGNLVLGPDVVEHLEELLLVSRAQISPKSQRLTLVRAPCALTPLSCRSESVIATICFQLDRSKLVVYFCDSLADDMSRRLT